MTGRATTTKNMREAAEDRRRRFAREFIIDFNRKAAAIRVGYSVKSAQAIGSALRKRPDVQAYIDEELQARARRVHVDADRVLQELARLAFFDVRKLFRADGTPIPIHELDDDTAAAISGVDVQETYEGTGKLRVFSGHIKRYRVADKNTALTNCLKHLGLLKETVVHTGPDGGAVQLTVEAAAALTHALRERLRRARGS
jgi:phage terminase small subunit